jgi:hypothetical protein
MQKLNYQIFLLDGENYAELDCEDLQLMTNFSITDIADISSRKDNLTKNITLKGTKNNNLIFGNIFNQSRYVDTEIVGNLFVNFSINKKVECQIYENSVLIIKGFLEFKQATSSKGQLTYECQITGNIYNFYSLLGDKSLSDLDFSEYTHEYRMNNITNSWYNSNYVNGVVVQSATGSGYVYPFINYGEGNSPKAEDINKVHLNNFRPAIYVKTYLDKIFNQDELTGFTYELKGSDDFLTSFNQLILPDNREYLSQSVRGVQLFSLNLTGNHTFSYNDGNTHYSGGRLINVVKFPDNLSSIYNNTLTASPHMWDGNYNTLFILNRSLVTDMVVHFNNITVTNHSGRFLKAYLRAWTRPRLNYDTDYGNWNNISNFTMLGETLIAELNNGASSTRTDITLAIAQTTLVGDSEMYFSVDLVQPDNQTFDKKYTVSLNGGTVRTPGNTASTVSYSVLKGDQIKPEAVSNLKQKDFVKSLALMFNLYSYSALFNPKHIIFESYNDYYSKTLPQNIINTSNVSDVSSKIDYDKDFSMSAFDKVSNKYTFKYKSDSDYYNKLYTDTYKQIYGEFTETYTLGTAAEKVIEVSFSPTPVVNIANTGRLAPEIYTSDSNGLHQAMKSNARILYYNGVKNCENYQVGTMLKSGDDYIFTQYIEIPTTGTYQQYAQVSHLRYGGDASSTSTIYSDLNFGITGQYYFPVNDVIYDTPNLFSNHYERQIKELTDTNNVIINCDVLLSESDISNLDLKVPIFIQNQYGNAYYKVLELEYSNRFETTTLKGQKINLVNFNLSGDTGSGSGGTSSGGTASGGDSNGYFTLSPSYGMTIVSLNGTGLPADFATANCTSNFTRPITGTIPSQNFSITISGTVPPLAMHIDMYVNGIQVDTTSFTSSGTKTLNLPSAVDSSDIVVIAINSGS